MKTPQAVIERGGSTKLDSSFKEIKNRRFVKIKRKRLHLKYPNT
jgi:hypothetical protein